MRRHFSFEYLNRGFCKIEYVRTGIAMLQETLFRLFRLLWVGAVFEHRAPHWEFGLAEALLSELCLPSPIMYTTCVFPGWRSCFARGVTLRFRRWAIIFAAAYWRKGTIYIARDNAVQKTLFVTMCKRRNRLQLWTADFYLFSLKIRGTGASSFWTLSIEWRSFTTHFTTTIRLSTNSPVVWHRFSWMSWFNRSLNSSGWPVCDPSFMKRENQRWALL